MKTKTVERLMAETPEDIKKQVSDFADILVTKRKKLLEMAEESWTPCDGCTAYDKDFYIKGFVTAGLIMYSEHDMRISYIQGFNRGLSDDPNHLEKYVDYLKSQKNE